MKNLIQKLINKIPYSIIKKKDLGLLLINYTTLNNIASQGKIYPVIDELESLKETTWDIERVERIIQHLKQSFYIEPTQPQQPIKTTKVTRKKPKCTLN